MAICPEENCNNETDIGRYGPIICDECLKKIVARSRLTRPRS